MARKVIDIMLGAIVILGIGLLGNVEQAEAATLNHETVVTLTPDMPVYHTVSQCNDGLPVYIAQDGTIFGDQDNNGILAGIDCDFT